MVTIGTPYKAIDDYEKDNYYIRDQSENRIFGDLAREMGITKISNESYSNLYYGKNAAGETMVKSGVNGKHRPGYDICFTPDKSISLAYHFGTDEQKRNISEAFHNSVKNTIDYIQNNLIQVRETSGKNTNHVDTDRMIAFGFTHNLSRTLDPNLHEHAVLFNITKNGNNWQAISNEKIIYNRKLIINIFENHLSQELKSKDINCEVDKGYARIPGMDDDLLAKFSKRSETVKEIIEIKKQKGESIGDETAFKNRVMLTTREGKVVVDQIKNNERLLNEMKEIGFTPEYIQNHIVNSKFQIEKKADDPNGLIKDALKIITVDKSAFTKYEVLKTALEISNHSTDEKELEKIFNKLNQNDNEILYLERGKYQKHNTEIYTTPEMKILESNNLKMVLNGQRSFIDTFDRNQVKTMIKDYTFTKSQEKAFENILVSKKNIEILQGNAGTGKTYLMDALSKAYNKKEFNTICLAPTGNAAEELSKATGRNSYTIDSFLLRKDEIMQGQGKTFFIVDECSMIGTKKMNQLLSEINNRDNKIILSGDKKQLKPIQAGKDFDLMVKESNPVILKDNIRQKNADMKKAVELFAEKKIDKAVEVLERNNSIKEIENKNMINELKKEFKNNNKSFAIITGTNARKDEINKAIRNELKQSGELETGKEHFIKRPINLSAEEKIQSKNYKNEYDLKIFKNINDNLKKGDLVKIKEIHNDRLKVENIGSKKESEIYLKNDYDKFGIYENQKLEISKGDKIQFQQNDYKIGIKNGQIGEVKNLEDNMIKVEMKNKTVNINLSRYNYIDHAYAITYDKSQGQTFNLKSGALDMMNTKQMNFEKSYVGVTRFVNDVKIYTENKTDLIKSMKQEQEKHAVKEHEIIQEQFKGIGMSR